MNSTVLVKRKDSFESKKKCMNCGKILTAETKDLYSRRFCSMKCKQTYFGEDMDLKDA